MQKKNKYHLYDYAGGSYFSVPLHWFFNAPENMGTVLIWIKYGADTFHWNIHGSIDKDGNFDEYLGYTKTHPITEKLRKHIYD